MMIWKPYSFAKWRQHLYGVGMFCGCVAVGMCGWVANLQGPFLDTQVASSSVSAMHWWQHSDTVDMYDAWLYDDVGLSLVW